MTTKKVVADGRVPNELLGSMYRKMHEIVRRTDEGTLDPWWVVNQLQSIVEGRARSLFPVWKTIRLGTGLKTADDFCSALKESGMRVGYGCANILGNSAFTVSEVEMEVDLVNVSVGGLGFKRGTPLRDIIDKALSLDLMLCPPEVGPQLRLQYKDQPRGESVFIGMEPIASLGSFIGMFNVERAPDGRWLYCGGSPGNVWDVEVRFAFVLPPRVVRLKRS